MTITDVEPDVYVCPQCGPAPEGADEHAERYHTFGAGEPLDEPEPEPEPAPRRKPGPPPNPNSQRQRKLAKKTAPAAKKRANPRASSAPAPAPTDNVYFRGAQTILGWVARPLAVAGLAGQISAATMPTKPDGSPTPRAIRLARHSEALALDSLTIAVHGDALAEGAASMADSLPWMAQTLEKAARVSPYATLLEAGASIVMQVLCNHGILPAAPMFGTLTPDQLRAAAGVVDADPE